MRTCLHLSASIVATTLLANCQHATPVETAVPETPGPKIAVPLRGDQRMLGSKFALPPGVIGFTTYDPAIPFTTFPPPAGNIPALMVTTAWSGPIWSTFTIHDVVREGSILHVNMHATYARQGGRIDPIDRVDSNFVAIEEIPPGNYLLDVHYEYFDPSTKPEAPITPPVGFPTRAQGRWLLEKDYASHKLAESGFLTASVTWHADEKAQFSLNDDRTAHISDAATIDRVAAMFSGTDSKSITQTDPWLIAVEVIFTRLDSTTVHVWVRPDLLAWTPGGTILAVQGDLRTLLASLAWNKITANSSEKWGDPVGGLQTRLRPSNSLWNVPDAKTRNPEPGIEFHTAKVPRLVFDTRNLSLHPVNLGATCEAQEIEVDGKIYRRSAVSIMSGGSPPGQRYDNIELPLDGGWASRDIPGGELKLAPGKHTVRLVSNSGTAFDISSTTAPAPDTHTYSNSVTVEILPDPVQAIRTSPPVTTAAIETTAPRSSEVSASAIPEFPLIPGDTLQIKVFELEFPGLWSTTTATVDAQGIIPIPGSKKAAPILAAGLTPSEFEKSLSDFCISQILMIPPGNNGPEISITRTHK